MTISLGVHGLSFSYDKGSVLREISLVLERSRVIAIVGGSGSGKTTLLKCLLMLLSPIRGRVCYFSDDSVVVEHGSEGNTMTHGNNGLTRHIRDRLGYVPQGSFLLPHMSLLDNVSLPLKAVRGVSADFAEIESRKVLDRLGIGAFALAKPWQVSGGQVQRAAIARAIVKQPELYLLDEPTSSLDAANIDAVGRAIKSDVVARGCSAIIATHNLGFAQVYCDEICVLRDGLLVGPTPIDVIDWQQMIQAVL